MKKDWSKVTRENVIEAIEEYEAYGLKGNSRSTSI